MPPDRILDFDRAATTPVSEHVLQEMQPYFRERYGNPASVHALGRAARRALEDARERLAAAVRASPADVTFTSGATEALHLGVLGVLAARRPLARGGDASGVHVVSAATEHSAAIEAVRAAQRAGASVTWVRPDERGVIEQPAVLEAMRPDTSLVVLMRVNNETGVRTDTVGIGRAVRERGGALLVDAVQAFGFEEVGFDALDADLLTVSAHKVGGPKGIGALVARPEIRFEPMLRGGGQERGRRGGTVAVALAVGFGAAAAVAADAWHDRAERVAALRDRLEAGLCRLEGVRVNGAGAERGPKHVNVHVAGVDGEALLINLDAAGVLASAGSACAAGSLEPSHVLMAMGMTAADARRSVRFSLGDHLDDDDVDEGVQRAAAAIAAARSA